jgi:hypothetical protein
VDAVLKLLDKDEDGKVTAEEFESVGLDGLPNFDDLGAEGHHYDIESGNYFPHIFNAPYLVIIMFQNFSFITKVRNLKFTSRLHLELIWPELFHSTPETQTDEAYNHPEDIEHFAHHDAIERSEAEKEAKFQGISVEEVLEAQHQAARSSQKSAEPDPQNDQAPPAQDPLAPPIPKVPRTRPPGKEEANIKSGLAAGANSKPLEWGQGDAGYKTPKSPVDRMRYGSLS